MVLWLNRRGRVAQVTTVLSLTNSAIKLPYDRGVQRRRARSSLRVLACHALPSGSASFLQTMFRVWGAVENKEVWFSFVVSATTLPLSF